MIYLGNTTTKIKWYFQDNVYSYLNKNKKTGFIKNWSFVNIVFEFGTIFYFVFVPNILKIKKTVYFLLHKIYTWFNFLLEVTLNIEDWNIITDKRKTYTL